jgi:hypothetical protein
MLEDFPLDTSARSKLVEDVAEREWFPLATVSAQLGVRHGTAV